MLKTTSNTLRTISKYLLIIMLYALLFGQLLSYHGEPYLKLNGNDIAYEQGSVTDKYIVLINLFAIFCVLFFFFTSIAAVNKIFFKTSIVLMLVVVVWTCITAMSEGVVSALYASTSPYVYLTALAFCIGYDEEFFEIFIKHAKIIGIISLVILIYNTITFMSTHPGAILADSLNLRLYIQSFFLLCTYSFCSEKPNKVLVYIEIAIITLTSLTFSSRSWLIQSVLWLVTFMYFSQKKKNLLEFVKVLVLVTAIVVVLLIIASNLIPEIVEIIIEKTDKDTRSQQYVDIFAQTSIFSWLFGEGYGFTYYSELQGGYYSYIDNSYLLIAVRYGIVMLAAYVIIFVTPLLKGGIRKETIPIILWLFALGGLSVFCMIIVDLKSVVLPIVAGRCMKLIENRRKDE